MLYFNGKGDPPTEAQVREAKRRRGVADDLFALYAQNWNEGRHKPQTSQE